MLCQGPLTSVNTVKPSSSPPSLLPIGLFAPPRSSSAPQLRVAVCHEQEQPSPFLGISPNAPFGQPRSLLEPTRTVFECLSPSRMRGQRLKARHRSPEAPWSTDLVLSSADGLLQLDYPLSSPSQGIVSSDIWGLWASSSFCESSRVMCFHDGGVVNWL